MKQRLLAVSLVIAIAWALTATVLYWRLSHNPRVVAITTDNGKDLSKSPTGSLERSNFAKQFAERFLSFDSTNFWQTQTSLTSLMSGSLRKERTEEISRLQESIRKKNIRQSAQVLSLTADSQESFSALVLLQMLEDNQKKDLYMQLFLQTESVERTLENPWGLSVISVEFPTKSPTPIPLPKTLTLAPNTPATLAFPCALDHVKNPQEDILQIKITTLTTSELQITALKPVQDDFQVIATCNKDLDFLISLKTAESGYDLYRALSWESATRRVQEKKIRKKNDYEKTLEKVLGIELD